MATQEITTETEPVEKETQPMDAEILSLEIRKIIRMALEKHLNKKGVKYEVKSYTDSQNVESDDNNFKGIIALAKDDSNRVIPHTWHANEHMIYSKTPAHQFTVFICTSKEIHDRRYFYVWTHEGRYYAMAPYFVSTSAKEDSVILCSNRLDLTEAALSKAPVEALIKALEQLTNRSNKEKGFNKDMYHWYSDGSDANFSVSRPINKKEDSWYWKVGEGESIGKMVLTTLLAQKAQLKFDETS